QRIAPMRPLCLSLLCLLLLRVPTFAADEAIFPDDAKLKVEAGNGAGGEGPAWHPKLGILSSGADNSIHQVDRAGKARVWRKGAGTNGLLFDRKGRLV